MTDSVAPKAPASTTGDQRPSHDQGGRFGGLFVHRREHPGTRGARGCSQAARHVYRLDRRPRSASPDLGSGRQLDRRGDGRSCDSHRPDHPARRERDRPRQRPRRAGWTPQADRSRCARGCPYRAPRRWQVRWWRLQGVWRPARRRRQRGQRAVGVDVRRIGARGQDLAPGVRARQADRPRSARSARPTDVPEPSRRSSRTSRCSRRSTGASTPSPSGCASRPT